MGVAFISLYIKYLGIEAYGLIGLFSVLQAWLGLLDMGMTPTLAREMARFTGGGHSTQSIRDLLRSIELSAAAVALLIAGAVALSANWIATSWLKSEDLPTDVVAQAFTIMGLVTALRLLEGLYRSAIVGLQRQVLVNAINSAMATVRGLGAVGVLAWVSPTIEAFFIWQGLASTATLLIFVAITYAKLPKGDRDGRFSVDALGGVWRFSSGVFLVSLMNMMTQIDKILLSRLLSLEEYGIYMIAVNIAFTLFVLIAPIQQAYYPRYCELYARGDTSSLIENYHCGAQLVTVIAGSAAIVLAIYSETILRLWIGERDPLRDAANLVSILAIGYLLLGCLVLPKEIMLAHAWTNLSVKLYACTVPIVIGLNMILVPRYGAKAAAIIQAGFAAVLLVTTIHFLHMKLLKSEKWRWYRQDILYPLTAASLAVGLMKLLWSAPRSALEMIAVLVAAIVVSLGASALAAPSIRRNIWSVVMRPRKKIQPKIVEI
jgi:O-antigen/teichoic acid export membrane protein